jgi:glucose-1-phosphate thymidylyltransferase
VSLGTGSIVRDSTLSDSVIGEKAMITGSRLHHAFLGDAVVVDGVSGSMSIGDHSEIRTEPRSGE